MKKLLMASAVSACMVLTAFAANAEQAVASPTPVAAGDVPMKQGPAILPASVRAATEGGGALPAGDAKAQATTQPRKPVLQFNPPKKNAAETQ